MKIIRNACERVCERKEEITPIYQIQYQENIEKAIKQVKEIINKQYKLQEKIARWISIKVLDGENHILKEIEKQLQIQLINNTEIDKVKNEVLKVLEKDGIHQEEFKEKIVSKMQKK